MTKQNKGFPRQRESSERRKKNEAKKKGFSSPK